MNNTQARRGESGNAFFYIMAGIVLLAALTMAVANSSRSTSTSLTDDRVRLFASEILGYGDAISKATATLRLRGVLPTALEFQAAPLTGYDNPACGDDSCRVFTPSGGGVTYAPAPRDWLDATFSGDANYERPVFTADTCVPGVGTGDSGCDGNADNSELVMFVPFMKRAICMKINDLLGVPNESDDAPEASDCVWATKFTGAYSASFIIDGATADSFNGRAAGCVKTPASCAAAPDAYHFYQVLSAR